MGHIPQQVRQAAKLPCKKCNAWVRNTFEAKIEHMYYEHTDMFVLGMLEAIKPTNARDIGRRVAEYFKTEPL